MEFSTHYLLMADHAMLQKLVMSRIKPLGLTTGQPESAGFPAGQHDGAMQKDIAKGCHIEPSSLSTILGGTERAGLLERRARDENRRTVYVRLTDLGREQCRRLNAIFAAAEEEALARLLTAGDAAGTDHARAYLSQSKQLKGDKIRSSMVCTCCISCGEKPRSASSSAAAKIAFKRRHCSRPRSVRRTYTVRRFSSRVLRSSSPARSIPPRMVESEERLDMAALGDILLHGAVSEHAGNPAAFGLSQWSGPSGCDARHDKVSAAWHGQP